MGAEEEEAEEELPPIAVDAVENLEKVEDACGDVLEPPTIGVEAVENEDEDELLCMHQDKHQIMIE